MTVRRITDPEEYIGLSTDEKPSVPTIGSTYEASDTGEKFKYDGENWNEDLTLIYALSQAFEL